MARTRRFIASTLFFLLASGAADAAPFVVNSPIDADDLTPGNGDCDTALGPGFCTLRAAIREANANPVHDTITIGQGLTIVLGADLPFLQHPVTIAGQGLPFDVGSLPVIDGDGSHRLFFVFNGVAGVVLRDLRIVNGKATHGYNGGGGLIVGVGSEAQVERVQFTGNVANSWGGGGAISAFGQLEIIDSDFDLNRSSSDGGAISVRQDGNVLIRNSSIRRSRAETVNAPAINVDGGTLRLENTLIDGNDNAPGATGSGGIRADQPALLSIRNSTLVNFTQRALFVDAAGGANIDVFNSILAGSDEPDCSILNAAAGNVTMDYNLIEDGSCAATSGLDTVTGVAPTLSPLAVDAGRFVRHRTPELGSLAVDAGYLPAASQTKGGGGLVPAALYCLTSDQRGTPRPLDGDGDGIARCDIGAIERSALDISHYIVNTGADADDADPGDNVCETGPGNNICTLRAAVMEANAYPGPGVITFEAGLSDIGLFLPEVVEPAVGGDLDITDALTISDEVLVDNQPRISIHQYTPVSQRVFEILTGAGQPVLIQGVRINSGDGGSVSGGGVRIASAAPVTLDTVLMTGNASDTAGGAVSVITGSLLLVDSNLSGNTVGVPAALARGAALFVGAGATATVRSSSIVENMDLGIGLLDAVHVEAGGSLTMENSTIAHNSGGILGLSATELRITQSTIAYNDQVGLRAEFGAGVQALELRSSIVSNNGVASCVFVNDADAEGLDFNAWNVVDEDSDCSPGTSNVVGDPALLVGLEYVDGGVGQVLFPLHEAVYDNPVLDLVPLGPSCLSADQRGVSRPQDLPDVDDFSGPCDAGAVELEVEEPLGDAIFGDGFEG